MKKLHYLYCIAMLTFILGSHNGFIALWKEGSSRPARVFPYQISALPAADQALLERGIPIRDQSQLNSLLEDYLS